MTSRQTDLLLGCLMTIAAALWCWGVLATIPGVEGEGRLGPRGFPLMAGVLLGSLGIAVFAGAVLRRSSKHSVSSFNHELGPVLAAAGLLAGYAFLLEQIGFLLATAAATAFAVGPVLKIWRWRLIAGMSLGLSLGVYLILGKALGLYLPYGKLINLAF